jgi:hypothetical protein
MQLGLHLKCQIFLSSFNKIWISQQIFIKVTNTKLHRNLSSGSNADACGQMGMTKLTNASRIYTNVPKNQLLHNCAYDIISIKYYVCVCVCTCLSYLTCKLCAILYCHLWYVWLYHIFPHYLIKS